jgi:hypothetical protein
MSEFNITEILDHARRGLKIVDRLGRARSQKTRVALLDLLEDRFETIELEANKLLSKSAN